MATNLSAVDFFCGAGGFSEGFRQQGINVVMGIENWLPAVLTHNINHNLNDKPMDILFFENDVHIIEERIPDTDIIIGSPPCVTFSMSNKAGKADKTLGLRLIEVYLRIITVKKYKKGSILKAWLMENVPNSRNYVQESYTFSDLKLSDWAISVGKKPLDIALYVKNNGDILTASDYGSPQSRQRFVCGEVIKTGKFPQPEKTHNYPEIAPIKPIITLGEIKSKLPSPYFKGDTQLWVDPNYPSLKIHSTQLTDHFYDTGLYQVEWQMAQYAKTNHPFMGRMSFPEDENRPSRTIMATRSASTREAIIFRSEIQRKGDGEYRLPTIREVSTLMGFPYTYQFTGGESTKWKQIGNAVCPHMSAALAKAILFQIGLPIIKDEDIDFSLQMENYKKINDLRSSDYNNFIKPPSKKKGTKFRMHPIKSGNMTVTLMNHNPNLPNDPETNGKRWFCNIYFGSGKKYHIVEVDRKIIESIKPIIEQMPDGNEFIKDFESTFEGRIVNSEKLQDLLEKNINIENEIYSPNLIVRKTADLVIQYQDGVIPVNGLFDKVINKNQIPKRQLFAIWALGMVVSYIKYKPQYRPMYLFKMRERIIRDFSNAELFND